MRFAAAFWIGLSRMQKSKYSIRDLTVWLLWDKNTFSKGAKIEVEEV